MSAKFWKMSGTMRIPQDRIPTADVEVFANGMGLGVRATRPFEVGEIVEICPCIINKSIEYTGDNRLPKSLQLFAFVWFPRGSVVVLGLGSLYNHSFKPSTTIYQSLFHDRPVVVSVAVKPIKTGEEITHDYTARYGDINGEGEPNVYPQSTLNRQKIC